jgi:putative ABC transport system substrate-binding protein
VDVIVARSNPGVSAARQATGSIPIVMSSGNDPVAAGHVKSLARPGGNITGIANPVSELEANRLELLKSAIPSLMRVGVLDNATFRRSDAALDDAGRALGVETKSFAIARRESLAETFAAMSRARVGAVLLQADPFVLEPNRAQIVALAARHRLPGMYPWRFYVESGGLMFELVVNLKTARAIELTIPPGFLLRADEVIE